MPDSALSFAFGSDVATIETSQEFLNPARQGERTDWMGGDEIDGNSRNTRRAHVRIGAQIRADGGPRFSVDVLDLSLSGFRIHSLNYIGPEARVVLTLPGLSPLSAHIVWANADIYGCAFDAPLYPAVLDHIVSKFPSFGDGDSA